MAKMPASMVAPDDFLFPDVPGRPFRAISIETEVDGNERDVARGLYTCGIIGTESKMAYGSHPGDNHPHVAFLKHDSSVTCGEVIFDRIYLNDATHAKGLRIALEKMRQLEKRGTIAYNPNCGGHIHMDASGYGFYDLLRLMVMFGYLEEPIFRLAGAGKQYGHRSLFKGYDRAHNGRGYSNPVVKGPFTDPVLALNHFRAQQRHSGLNVVKYLAARCRGGCTLLPVKEGDDVVDQEVERRIEQWREAYRRDSGRYPPSSAVAEEREYLATTLRRRQHIDYKLCTCPQAQHTIEWRVWNSTGNPRILYAWIALMQAMHAYAWRPHNDSAYRAHEHAEPLGWERRPFDGSDLKYLAQAKERVEFMFTELPLRDVEKDALAYAFMRTPYKVFGKDYFRKLAQTTCKPVPFPNEYRGIPIRKIGDVKELAEEAQERPLDAARRAAGLEATPNSPPSSQSGQRPRRVQQDDSPALTYLQQVTRSLFPEDYPQEYTEADVQPSVAPRLWSPSEVRDYYGAPPTQEGR